MDSGKNLFIVPNNSKFQQVLEEAKHLAATRNPVLIAGEPGSGKKCLAQYIHQNSARKNGPFMVIDCSGSFQEVRGKILGYRDDSGKFHKGAFESANGGTVVLAHIEELEEGFQSKLFTIIQELADYDITLRLLATTTKNLSKLVNAGTFSRTLYNYISGTTLMTVPVREMSEDIGTFVEGMIKVLANDSQESCPQIPADFFSKFKEQYWANNFKELKEAVFSSYKNRKDDTLVYENNDSPVFDGSPSPLSEFDGIKLMSLREAEQLLIQKALVHTAENRTQAAKILGVSIRTLRNKINEYRSVGHTYFLGLR